MTGKSSPNLTKTSFDYNVDFQELLIQMNLKYINADLSKIDDLINLSLNQIADFVGADRAYVYSYDFKNNTTTNSHEYCASGVEPQISKRQNVPLEFMPNVLKTHKKGNLFYISNVELLSDEHDLDMKLKLQAAGIKSLIVIPQFFKGELLGYIGFERLKESKIYSLTEKNLFIVFANMLVNIMQRKKYEDYLQEQEQFNFQLTQNLQKKTKEVDDYMHMVSHELKAPLVSMHTLLGWYIEDNKDGLSKNRLSQLSEILFHVEKMDTITKGILEYSNIEKGKLSEEKIDLNSLVNSIIKNNPNTTHVEVNIQQALPIVVGNLWRLTQLFNNLITNAVQFNESKKPIIYIGFEDKKKYYEFFIKDNGIGIDKEYHSKIFEVFRKLDNTKNTIGIGLSTVKRIVEYYNGYVWVDSRKGFGSSFYFTLPKKRSTNLVRFLKKKIGKLQK